MIAPAIARVLARSAVLLAATSNILDNAEKINAALRAGTMQGGQDRLTCLSAWA